MRNEKSICLKRRLEKMGKVKTFINLSLRAILSVVFIYAAVSKILRPDEFYADIRNYRMVPDYIAYASAYFLPAFEIIVALSIFSKRFFKASILSIAFLLTVFIMALASAWLRGLDINCGCFGSGAPSGYGLVILRDVFLLSICFILVLINSKKSIIILSYERK